VRKIGGTTLRSAGHVTRVQRILDNDAEYVSPPDMLAELRDDNAQLSRSMRQTHLLCDEAGCHRKPAGKLDRGDREAYLVPVRMHTAGLGQAQLLVEPLRDVKLLLKTWCSRRLAPRVGLARFPGSRALGPSYPCPT